VVDLWDKRYQKDTQPLVSLIGCISLSRV
jgi:hypothetical protein